MKGSCVSKSSFKIQKIQGPRNFVMPRALSYCDVQRKTSPEEQKRKATVDQKTCHEDTVELGYYDVQRKLVLKNRSEELLWTRRPVMKT